MIELQRLKSHLYIIIVNLILLTIKRIHNMTDLEIIIVGWFATLGLMAVSYMIIRMRNESRRLKKAKTAGLSVIWNHGGITLYSDEFISKLDSGNQISER